MVTMKASVTNIALFIGVVISLIFVVFQMTSLAPKVVDKCKLLHSTNSTTTEPFTDFDKCPRTAHCNFGFVFGWSMFIWMRMAVAVFFVTANLLLIVRCIIDSAAAEEGLADSDEEKEYKAACEERSKATKALTDASAAYKAGELEADAQERKKLLAKFQESIGALNLAENKVEAMKPARGMRRVVWRRWTRFLYCLALCFLTVGCYFANISFFLSLEAEIGCVQKPAYYIPHVAPAVLITVTALYLGIDACRFD